MKLLLDSHVLLWWLASSRELSDRIYEIMKDADSLAVSLVTPWELQIEVAASKLDMAPDWYRLDLDDIEVLNPTLDDVLLAANLPLHHRDPFDRLIIAQALRRDLVVATRDAVFSRYGVAVLAAWLRSAAPRERRNR